MYVFILIYCCTGWMKCKCDNIVTGTGVGKPVLYCFLFWPACLFGSWWLLIANCQQLAKYDHNLHIKIWSYLASCLPIVKIESCVANTLQWWWSWRGRSLEWQSPDSHYGPPGCPQWNWRWSPQCRWSHTRTGWQWRLCYLGSKGGSRGVPVKTGNGS